ncbi:MAG: hypothetical protein HGB05_05600, partial [Chloroflexi bacterium]|nr:hypothetical protein [Chloroflexota bacterium]
LTFYALRFALFAFVLALALTAFFWLPALTEGQSAQLYLTHSTRGNDYHFNFATVAEVFGPPGSSDPALLNPPLRIVLGWAQVALAVLGVVLIKRLTSREQRAHVIIAAIAAVIFILMALPISLPLWDTLPLIRFVQFPWRFVGRAILPVSLLAGAAAYAIFHSSLFTRHLSRIAHYVLRLTLLLLFTLPALLSATPLLYPRICPGPIDLNINNVFAYERATGHTGVDPLGAYLPMTVVERPIGSALEAQYAAGEPIKRFDRSTLPEGAQIVSEAYQPNRAEVTLASPTAFRATYLTFDFPGWGVAIDDQPVPIVPSDPNGLITFGVPAGQHTIRVTFEDTALRTLANVISLAALAVFGGVLVLWHKMPATQSRTSWADADRRPAPTGEVAPTEVDAQRNARQARISHRDTLVQFASPWPWWSYLAVPLVFLSLKVLLIDPQLTPLRQPQLQAGALQNLQTPLSIDYGDQLRLLGYTVSPGSAPSGETVRVNLYWRALQPPETSYQMTVGLVDANSEVWSPKTLDRPRDYQDYPPTNTWPTDAYVVDSFELPIDPGTPPGEYRIIAEVFKRGSLLPLPTQAEASRPASRPWAAHIGPLEVTRAQRALKADELGIYNLRADQMLTPEIQLIGTNRDRDDVLAGDTVLLTLFWQAVQKPPTDYFATVELVNDQEASIVRQSFPLGGGRYPTSQWQMGEQIVDLNRVRVPPGLPGGLYRWRVSIGSSEPIELGELRVSAPERSFEMPPIEKQIDQTLGDQATLLGYDFARCTMRDAECRVKLWWRAEANMPESYKVFVHLLDANGVPRAQADALPQNGTRPTWSWLPGEIIADEIVLNLPVDLPAGQYRLTTGLYNELDGTRLTLPGGADAIELAAIDLR